MKILVSNPVKQYTHHLCYGLQQKDLLQAFMTTFWYKPDSPIQKDFVARLPQKIRDEVVHTFRKRYHPGIDPDKVITHWPPELLRQIGTKLFQLTSEKWIFKVERNHDRFVASQLEKVKPDLIIAYEKSALETFTEAKRLGIPTVLDLAQVHYQFIADLREDFPEFREVLGDEKLLSTINQVKQQEYELADHILTLSGFARQTLTDRGIPESKSSAINLGFDPNKFSPKADYRGDGVFRLMFAGTVTQRKGMRVLLEAFKRLNLSNAELYIVGPVSDARAVMDEYRGSYTYVPFLHHQELVAYYQMADVFVFPSLLDSWAMVVLEAMACGTPDIVL